MTTVAPQVGPSRGAFSPRVAVLLDHPQRDLPAVVLTAFELCQRGAVCHIVPATLREPELWALEPDYVLLFHFRRGFAPLAARMAEAGIRFGVLDNEGGIWPDLADYARPLCDDPRLRGLVSPLCVWGDRIRDFLAEEDLFSAEEIVVTGGPRFDFYDPRWRAISGAAAAKGSTDASRLLVVTNYSEVNPRFGDVAEVRRHMEGVFGLAPGEVDELLAWQGEALERTVELVRQLGRDFPDAEVAVRPHPFEGSALYAERLSPLGNVVLSRAASIVEDVVASRAVIQRYSTTAIDAGFAGVPSIVPLWIPSPSYPVIEAVSAACADYGELREEVASILSGARGIPELRRMRIAEALRDWFGPADGEAHRRCAEAVASRLPTERGVSKEACARFLQFLHSPTRPHVRAGRRLRRALRLSPQWSFRRLREEPPRQWLASDQFYDAALVERLVDRVLAAKRSAGEAVRPVSVLPARDAGDYALHFAGQSVTMRGEAA